MLLKKIETAAITKGFYGSHLETTDFQVAEFYFKHGYELIGEIKGKPKGHSWFFIKKILVPSDYEIQLNR